MDEQILAQLKRIENAIWWVFTFLIVMIILTFFGAVFLMP